MNAMAASTSSLASRVEKQFNPGYADSLDDDQSNARYADKLGAYLSGEMLNYKSLDSFRNFQNGWVREVLVKEVGNKRLVIGKVS